MTPEQIIAETNKTIDRFKGYVESYEDGLITPSEMYAQIVNEATTLIRTLVNSK